MFKTENDFKIGYLKSLDNQQFEIEDNKSYLEFFIKGEENDNIYSLDFKTRISIDKMLEFRQYEHINFIDYLDEGDIVFGKNGVFDLDVEIKMDIVRYLPNKFILNIDFKDSDGVVGNLELHFIYEK